MKSKKANKKNLFVCFLEESTACQSAFDFIWPSDKANLRFFSNFQTECHICTQKAIFTSTKPQKCWSIDYFYCHCNITIRRPIQFHAELRNEWFSGNTKETSMKINQFRASILALNSQYIDGTVNLLSTSEFIGELNKPAPPSGFPRSLTIHMTLEIG